MNNQTYTYNRADGGTTVCYGKLEEGSNFELICRSELADGIVADIDVTEKETNTWFKICKMLEKTYNKHIEEIITC